MSRLKIQPTGSERRFADDVIIVSKTDRSGRIAYVNRAFCDVSLYERQELLGAPHSLIRHPEMPRAVFKALWDSIQAGREIFAYINNLCKNGDHYWVLAHVTPTVAAGGEVVGYHSTRRTPGAAALAKVEPLYARLRAVEEKHTRHQDAAQAGTVELNAFLTAQGASYDEYVWSL